MYTLLSNWLTGFLEEVPDSLGMQTQPHAKQQPPLITSWSQSNHGSRAMRGGWPLPCICAPHVCMKNLLSTLYLELVLSVTFGNKRTFIAKFRMVLNFMAASICIQTCVIWISLWSCWQHMTFWFWDRLIKRCIVIRLLTTHFRELSVNKSKSYALNLLKKIHVNLKTNGKKNQCQNDLFLFSKPKALRTLFTELKIVVGLVSFLLERKEAQDGKAVNGKIF